MDKGRLGKDLHKKTDFLIRVKTDGTNELVKVRTSPWTVILVLMAIITSLVGPSLLIILITS